MECIRFTFVGIVEYCVGCDNIAPFDGDGHCFICCCDHPHSSINDDDYSQEDFESEVNMYQRFTIEASDMPNFK